MQQHGWIPKTSQVKEASHKIYVNQTFKYKKLLSYNTNIVIENFYNYRKDV